jgi:hypothetical protein
MFTVTCPRCQRSGGVRQAQVGKRVKCLGCGGIFIPAPERAAEEQVPRRAKRRRRSSRPWVVLAAVLLGLGVVGGAGFLLAQFLTTEANSPSASRLAKARSPKPGPAKPGVAKPDPGKPQPAKPDPGKPEAAKPAPKPVVLTELDKKLADYLKLIKPQPGEWQWASIPWVSTVWEARKKAAEQGKPMYIWYMAGEPLGQC